MTTEATARPEAVFNPPSRLAVMGSAILNLAGRAPLIGEWVGNRSVQNAQNRVAHALDNALVDWQAFVAKYSNNLEIPTTAVDIPCRVGTFGGMQQIPVGYNVLATNVLGNKGKLRVTYGRTVGENNEYTETVNIGDVYEVTRWIDEYNNAQIRVIALFDNGGLGRGTKEMMLSQIRDVDALNFLARLVRMASKGARSKEKKYTLSD